MNYFELFEIEETFSPDLVVIKKKFYELSRKFHPDFYTQAPQQEQADVLEMASALNKAYKTFQSKDATLQYLLQHKGLLQEDEKYQLPPDFLMEVMELNEQLSDAAMDENEQKLEAIKQEIEAFKDKIYTSVTGIIEDYNADKTSSAELLRVKQYYFEKKYLDRILAAMQ